MSSEALSLRQRIQIILACKTAGCEDKTLRDFLAIMPTPDKSDSDLLHDSEAIVGMFAYKLIGFTTDNIAKIFEWESEDIETWWDFGKQTVPLLSGNQPEGSHTVAGLSKIWPRDLDNPVDDSPAEPESDS
jgi:hypothetical protein